MASTEQCRVSVTQNTDPSSCLAPAQEMSELMSAVTILATVQPDWGFKLELQTKVKRRLVSIVSYSRLSRDCETDGSSAALLVTHLIQPRFL